MPVPATRRRLVLVGLFVAVAILGVMSASQYARSAPASYYLALGDSLSVGYQPAHDGIPNGRTTDGYADDVTAALRREHRSVRLVKLGCPRETTTTMISGGICSYAHYRTGSQLAAATLFLATHRGQVRYLTLNIGINDVLHCLPDGATESGCITHGLAAITRNLDTILATLRKVDGGVTVSVGMSYYDPFLADWSNGAEGKRIAAASASVISRLNLVEHSLYQRFGFAVADVAGAYDDDSTTPSMPGATPPNVQAICALTYMCEQRNIHPNADGYAVIADAFTARFPRPASAGQP
jgi:lysophospholipase L1-like esterase